MHREEPALARALKMEWPRNVLRHSFIFYCVAIIISADQFTLETGNSPTVIFKNCREPATDDEAAALLHLTPKGQQTVRHYGTYSNKTRGQTPLIPDRIIQLPKPDTPTVKPPPAQILLIPAPPKQSARDMRPLWLDLILQVWGGDPLQCTCCNGTMKPVRKVIRREQIEFFRLHGLWEGIVTRPRPPPPPFDIETMEPIEPPWQAIKEWIPDEEPDLDWFNRPRDPSNRDPDGIDQSQTWKAPEIQLDDGRILALEYT